MAPKKERFLEAHSVAQIRHQPIYNLQRHPIHQSGVSNPKFDTQSHKSTSTLGEIQPAGPQGPRDLAFEARPMSLIRSLVDQVITHSKRNSRRSDWSPELRWLHQPLRNAKQTDFQGAQPREGGLGLQNSKSECLEVESLVERKPRVGPGLGP